MREPKARLSPRDARAQDDVAASDAGLRVPAPSVVGFSSRSQIEIGSQTDALPHFVEM